MFHFIQTEDTIIFSVRIPRIFSLKLWMGMTMQL